MPIDALPNLASYMQTHRLSEMVTHPPAVINMSFRGGLNTCASQPQPLAQPFRIVRTLTMSRPKGAAPRGAVALQGTPQPKHRIPLSLQAAAHPLVGDIQLQTDHRQRAAKGEVGRLRLAATRRQLHVGSRSGGVEHSRH
jgi:hypothetical protein